MRPSILALLLVASTAAAEPYYPHAVTPSNPPEPEGFVESAFIGGGVGLSMDHFFNSFYDVEAGLRIPNTNLWIRATAGRGDSGDWVGTGDYSQARIGVEARPGCKRSRGCLFLGAEIGTQRQTWSDGGDDMEEHSGRILGTRFGFDVGGEHLRFRFGVEAYRYYRESNVGNETDGGMGFTLAVVHRL